jgi:hypothetical protein
MIGSISMMPVRVCLGLAGLACSAIACDWGVPHGFTVQDAGSDSTIQDAAGARYAVRGTAVGVLAPLDLHLEHAGQSEIIRITRDGAFAFASLLEDGAEYTITPVDDAPCVVADGTGVVQGADLGIELACAPVLLTALSISGTAAPDLGFLPARREYGVDVSLLQQSVRVTATAASTDASVEIAGNAVASSTPSMLLPLALGENTIEVVVRHVGGAERTYRLHIRRAASLAQHAYAKPTNTDAGDTFGASVAVWGDTLAVGAPYDDSRATGVGGSQGNDEDFENSGAVYVFQRTGDTWNQEAYLKASNTRGASEFGISVALWGDTLAVGAWGEASPLPGDSGTAPDSGAVYVFRRADGAWKEEAYLKASNAGAGDEFGWSVALWGDTLAVGAPEEDSGSREINGNQADDSEPLSGAVYVFQRTATRWTQQAYIKASNAEQGDEFGISVALWNDVLAVGAYLEDSAATGIEGDQHAEREPGDSGAAYVFRRTGNTWAQEAYVKASNTGDGDHFGFVLVLWGDTLAVGAVYEDSDATGVNGDQRNENGNDSGAVYVFRYANGAWAQEAYLKSASSMRGDKFGNSLALCGDTLAAGTFQVDGESGAAYVFQRADNAWSQRAYVRASNRDAGDWFAYDLALSDDTLAIGATREDSASTGVNRDGDDESATDSGAVYVFH